MGLHEAGDAVQEHAVVAPVAHVAGDAVDGIALDGEAFTLYLNFERGRGLGDLRAVDMDPDTAAVDVPVFQGYVREAFYLEVDFRERVPGGLEVFRDGDVLVGNDRDDQVLEDRGGIDFFEFDGLE